MKQVIALGNGKAREYDGVREPELPFGLRRIEAGGKVPENFSTNDHVDYYYEMEQYRAHISTLPVFDVIGGDWKEGEVKTEGVDYRIEPKHTYWNEVRAKNVTVPTVIVPIFIK